MPSDKLCLSVQEAAHLLGLSRASTYLAISTKQIPFIKIGKRILIPRFSLERMLAETTPTPK